MKSNSVMPLCVSTIFLSACGGGGGGGTPPVTPPPPPPLQVSIADSSVPEGDSGSSVMSFSATLNRTANTAVTVDYAFTDDSAIKGEDYDATDGTLTIPVGAVSGTIQVTVLGDIEYADSDPEERFRLTLNNPSGATLSASSSATGTIENDDLTKKEAYDQLWVDYIEYFNNEIEPLVVVGSNTHLEGVNIDLDADGDLDVVTGVSLGDDSSVQLQINGEVFIARNNVGNGFVVEPAGVVGWFRSAQVRDFNGDGLDDVYFAQTGYDQPPFPGGTDYLYLQTIDGGLIDVTLTNLPPILDWAHGACAADFDANGGVDVVTTNGFSFKMLMNNGAGFFANEADSRFPLIPLSAEAVADAGLEAGIPPDELQFLGHAWWWCNTMDADSDGDMDVIVGGFNPDGIRTYDGDDLAHKHVLLFNDGAGNLSYDSTQSRIQATPPISQQAGFGSLMLVDDFNGDGCPDFVAAGTDDNPSDGVVEDVIDFFLNDCAGQFTVIYTYTHGSWISLMSAIEDLNGDGVSEYVQFGNVFFAGQFIYENDQGLITQRALSVQDLYLVSPATFLGAAGALL
jgi:hypothetical protein